MITKTKIKKTYKIYFYFSIFKIFHITIFKNYFKKQLYNTRVCFKKYETIFKNSIHTKALFTMVNLPPSNQRCKMGRPEPACLSPHSKRVRKAKPGLHHEARGQAHGLPIFIFIFFNFLLCIFIFLLYILLIF